MTSRGHVQIPQGEPKIEAIYAMIWTLTQDLRSHQQLRFAGQIISDTNKKTVANFKLRVRKTIDMQADQVLDRRGISHRFHTSPARHVSMATPV